MENEEKNWGMFCHLAAFAGFFIPFGNIIGPLIIWLMKREEMPFVDANGKAALNFQITIGLLSIVFGILVFVFIGVILLGILAIFNVIMIIIASIKTSEGEVYEYPFTLRLIK